MAKVAEMGYGSTDQATSKVCKALSKARDGHDGNMERVATPLVRKSGASRRHRAKVKREE